jgi:CheY-like chemotaxis protein
MSGREGNPIERRPIDAEHVGCPHAWLTRADLRVLTVQDAARVSRPDLKVLFITGYAENSILGNGHLAPGMAVLTKPFLIDTMAERIRSMIEAKV